MLYGLCTNCFHFIVIVQVKDIEGNRDIALENEALTFKRADQDFDATGFVQTLITKFQDDIEAAVKNVRVVAANKVIELINREGQLDLQLDDFNAAISTLEGFKALLQNRQGLPGNLNLTPDNIDIFIRKINEAL